MTCPPLTLLFLEDYFAGCKTTNSTGIPGLDCVTDITVSALLTILVGTFTGSKRALLMVDGDGAEGLGIELSTGRFGLDVVAFRAVELLLLADYESICCSKAASHHHSLIHHGKLQVMMVLPHCWIP